MAKYYVIAGELSGDIHASNMMKHLLDIDSKINFRFWGGDMMSKITGKLPIKHIKDLSFMGFVDVLKNIRTIFKNIAFCKKDILEYKPDILILVDFPGFNLRIADWAKKQGFIIIYYISPTIWAWHESRVNTIKRVCDKMYVILPFEPEVYAKHNYTAEYVGHPLLDAIADKKNELLNFEIFKKTNQLTNKKIVALLPGSRKQEIKKMLKVMLSVVHHFPHYQFVIAGTHNLSPSAYNLAHQQNVKVIYNQTYALMQHAHIGLIKSGTSTLESAIFKLPQVICYKAGALSIKIARLLVGNRVKYIGLPNLIMNEPIVTELLQEDFTSERLILEINLLLEEKNRNEILNKYDQLIELLGNSGASKKVAHSIYDYLNKKQ